MAVSAASVSQLGIPGAVQVADSGPNVPMVAEYTAEGGFPGHQASAPFSPVAMLPGSVS